MQGPASVSLEAADDTGAWRVAVVGLHAAAAAALLAWMPGWPAAIAAAAVALAAAPALRALSNASVGTLRWDGQAWWLADRAVDPHVAVDLGGWMLLRLRPATGSVWRPFVFRPFARARWLPLSASRAGAAWPAVRSALFATADRSGPRGGWPA